MQKQHKKIWRRILVAAGCIVATPIVLFLLLAILIYIPPVQNFAVRKVAAGLSESLGMSVGVERVRLAFPLDLAVHNVLAATPSDTVLDLRALRLSVPLRPLFSGRIDVDGFEIYDAKVNTLDLIPDTHVQGRVGELAASAHGIDLARELVRLDKVSLRKADVSVALSDTAAKDTTTSTARWRIDVDKADIADTRFRLSMPGDSMRLSGNIGEAALRGIVLETGPGNYGLRSLFLAKTSLAYDLPYEPAQPKGLDANHIALTNLYLKTGAASYDSCGTLRLDLQRIALQERSGLAVSDLSGQVYMDSLRLSVPALRFATPHSRLDAGIEFDRRALRAGNLGKMKFNVDASFGAEDIRTALTGFVDEATIKSYPSKPLLLTATAMGNMEHFTLESLAASLPGILQLKAHGYGKNLADQRRSGRVWLDARTGSLAAVRSLLPKDLRQSIDLPDGMSLRGYGAMSGTRYEADAALLCGGGTLGVKAAYNERGDAYNVKASAKSFPIASFVKGIGGDRLTADASASGAGFDFMSVRSRLKAAANVEHLVLNGIDLSKISLDANLERGEAEAAFRAANPHVSGSGTLAAHLAPGDLTANLKAALEEVDLRALGATKDTLLLGVNIDVNARADKKFTAYGAEGSLRNIVFTDSKRSAMAKDIVFDAALSPDTTHAAVSAGDLYLYFDTGHSLDEITAAVSQITSEAERQMAARDLDFNSLKTLFPTLSFRLDAGRDNPLANIVRLKGYQMSSARLRLDTSPLVGMTGRLRLGTLVTSGLQVDTIDMELGQDTAGLVLDGFVRNDHKKNPVKFESRLNAFVHRDDMGARFQFFNKEGVKGVDLGVRAAIAEGGMNVSLFPENPVIAFRNFKVNRDNLIYLGRDKSIRANVDLLADDGTGLKLYGEPVDSANDLTFSLNHVNMAELSNVLPYMPKLAGLFSGDFHLTDSRTEGFSAMASMEVAQFAYEGVALGDVGVEAIYLPKQGGEHHASAFVSSNGTEVLAAEGTYFDRDGGSFEGDARLYDFPLQLVNGFLVGTDVALAGTAGGELAVKGTLDKPVVNGSLDLDSTHIYSDVYGFDLRTDERAVQIKDSRLVFDRYNLYSTGKNPLVLNGTLDMSNLSRIGMNFDLMGENFELINTKRKRQSMIFGKVYTDVNATMRGTLDNLFIRGNLYVRDRTDVTYILKDSPLTVDDRLHDLVTFTSFEDSAAAEVAPPAPESTFDMSIGVTVNDAARFHCNLSEDGQNYVDIEGGGNLTMRMTQQNETRLTGRFTINSGEMKYSLPVIPLKTFTLVQGSYIEFTGDMMNPTLNITAKERMKAVVSDGDQSRSVAFDVGVAITKPLNDMGLEFVIEAPEDLAVTNQLASMSREQRGKAAVTMLATGMYLTDESMMNGSGFKASNALNAFLQSEIQNIAGSALKTVDLSIGVESGTSEMGTETTDYSFKFAKRFWGDRISVIVGGKVSTGEDATNSAASIIDNISVEYRLDKSSSRYVKMFYDRDTRDPLEGQLTKTGVGLVLRRKTDKLGELFIFKKKK